MHKTCYHLHGCRACGTVVAQNLQRYEWKHFNNFDVWHESCFLADQRQLRVHFDLIFSSPHSVALGTFDRIIDHMTADGTLDLLQRAEESLRNRIRCDLCKGIGGYRSFCRLLWESVRDQILARTAAVGSNIGSAVGSNIESDIGSNKETKENKEMKEIK